MQIGTQYNVLWLLEALTSPAGLPGGSSSTSTPTESGSLFGPAATVALGDTSLQSTSLYGGWQFDLAAALRSSASLGEAPIPEAQQKQEAQVITTALEHIEGDDFAGARDLLNGLLATNPRNAAAVHALGYAAQEAGDYDLAEQLFLKAHALNATVGYDQDARNARILQRDDAAVYAQAKAMAASPATREEGIRVLMALTARSPGNAQAHLALGDALLYEGDALNGLLQYDTAVRTAPPELLRQIAVKLDELVAEQPESAFLHQLVGKVQLRREEYDAALQSLTRAAELSENAPAYHRTLAEAYVGVGRQRLARGDLARAMSSFEQAKALHPSGLDVKQALGEGYLALARKHRAWHDYDDALGYYRQVATYLSGPDTEALRDAAASEAYRIGQALERRRIEADGEIDGEARAFQLAHELDPDNKTYRLKLAGVRAALGDQYSADGEHEAAAYAYRQAFELDPYTRAYRDQARDAFVAWGDWAAYNLRHDEALEAYREALALDTEDVAVRQHVADAYFARGIDFLEDRRFADAARDFREAWHLFSDNEQFRAYYERYAAYLN